MIATLLGSGAQRSTVGTTSAAGIGVAVGSNFINNLPAGLLAGSAVQAAHEVDELTRSVLIGVDLG